MTARLERNAVRLAWGVGLCCVGLVTASLVLLALDWKAIDSPSTAQLPWYLDTAVAGALGVLIAARRPRNPIGWLLLAIAAGNAVYLTADFIAIRALQSGASPSGWVVWHAWVFNWTGAFGAVLLGFLIFFFPNGKLPGPGWRWAAWSAVAASAVSTAGGMVTPGSVQLSPRLPDVATPGIAALAGSGAFSVGLFVLLVVTVAAVAVRLRRASGVERQQLRWFSYVAAAAIGLTLAGFLVGIANQGIGNDVAGAGFDLGIGVLLPATIGLAIMRHGLYDIDVFISRTLVYGSLAVFITAVYVGIAVGIGALVGSGGKPNLGLSILATGIVAVGFQPVRERVQRVANRLVYGARATPYEVLSQFSERVAESHASEDVLPRMARVLGEGTNADLAEVWLRHDDALQRAAVFPLDDAAPAAVHLNGTALAIPGADRSVVVRHQGEVLGALTVTKRRGEQITPIEVKLMDDLAHQAGLVLKNVGLTADLQARLVELRASRQRLVAAQDDERRRLERNLHDGVQQNLVAIKVKLGLAEMMSSKDPAKARELISSLKSDTDDALETLRDLARGIYPPLLAEKGLKAALESQARKATVPVTVDGDGVGRYPQEIEAAVYFCVLEALQNVQKYAVASNATVRLSETQNVLQFRVDDDGRGFDAARTARGAGLTNMEDRLDALGGTLTILSEPGRSTRISGSLPLPALNVVR